MFRLEVFADGQTSTSDEALIAFFLRIAVPHFQHDAHDFIELT